MKKDIIIVITEMIVHLLQPKILKEYTEINIIVKDYYKDRQETRLKKKKKEEKQLLWIIFERCYPLLETFEKSSQSFSFSFFFFLFFSCFFPNYVCQTLFYCLLSKLSYHYQLPSFISLKLFGQQNYSLSFFFILKRLQREKV